MHLRGLIELALALAKSRRLAPRNKIVTNQLYVCFDRRFRDGEIAYLLRQSHYIGIERSRTRLCLHCALQ